MKALLIITALAVVGVAPCAAGELLLTGQYQCVQNCKGTGPAYITQSVQELHLINEAGQSSRGWIDDSGHLWAQIWREGATYSPDGFIIFDDGTAWQRIVPPAPLPLPPAPIPYFHSR
ncbi:MAG TPA: hypothetical protein VGG11_06670 [Xanthobacteraceae bacterium]|jgi:hypothetical protein